MSSVFRLRLKLFCLLIEGLFNTVALRFIDEDRFVGFALFIGFVLRGIGGVGVVGIINGLKCGCIGSLLDENIFSLLLKLDENIFSLCIR